MPTLDPGRLDRFSVPSLALMQSRKDIRDLVDRRWAAVDARLRSEGAADREVLGIPEPVQPYRPRTWWEALGVMTASFENALAQLGRQFQAGYDATRRTDDR